MAKFGTFKYGEKLYGRTVDVGNGSITPSSTLGILKVLLITVGNGITTIYGVIVKQYQKIMDRGITPTTTLNALSFFFRGVGNNTLMPVGSLQKATSKFITSSIEISTSISKALSKTFQKSLSIIGELSKAATFFRGVGGILKIKSMTQLFKPFFYVTANNILMPLGLRVKRDSRIELFPSIKEQSEAIPGRHGQIQMSSKLKPRHLEFHVVTEKGFDYTLRESLKRKIASMLNPTLGKKSLVFEDEPDKVYYVKYSGNTEISQYPNWFEFVIPFKMSDPYIYCSWETKSLGSGNIENIGNIEAPVIIEIDGSITNPSIIIDSKTYSFAGTIASGSKLIVDSAEMTVFLNSENVLDNWNGGFPKIAPGIHFIVAPDCATIKLIARWV